MVKKPNDTAILVDILLKDKKMSMQEVADYLGVTKYLVFNWWHERNYATQKNLDRLRDTVTKLNGREIRYPRQALDVLREIDREQ